MATLAVLLVYLVPVQVLEGEDTGRDRIGPPAGAGPENALPLYWLIEKGTQDVVAVPTFRTPLTPGGNIAVPPVGAPRSRDGGPG